MTWGSLLATRNVAALGPSQQESAARGGRDTDWYPLQVPDETPPNLPVLTCAPALVNMGDGNSARDYEIVGVVEDVKYTSPDQPTRSMIFLKPKVYSETLI